MTIPDLVTTAQARANLKLSSTVDDADLQLKIDAATQLVCEYIADRQPENADWIDTIEQWGAGSPAESAPAVVIHAVLLQVAELYRFRGDDTDGKAPALQANHGFLSPMVTRMLSRYRSPVLA